MKFSNLIYTIIFLFVIQTAQAHVYFTVKDTLKIKREKNKEVTEKNFVHLKEGDLFPNIVLYDTSGKIVPIDSVFKDDKGVIFVNGSYTCPSFRGNVKQMNQMVSNQVHTYRIYFVYTQEAHPISESPYGKSQNNSELNKKSAIFIGQQRSVEERIFYARKAAKDFKLKANILVDNEKNEFFWNIFSGPNGFMIFSRDRKLVRQQVWFNPTNKKTKKELKDSEELPQKKSGKKEKKH